MYKGHPFANKVLQRLQVEKLLENHRQNLKQARPNTQFLQTRQHFVTLNPKKKQMIRQAKFTQIQRQNRLLLQKITSIMSKKRSNSENQMNKSLNSTFRRKQSQTIEVQNAKMLRRLQQRKSDYQISKYKKEWSKTKKMIKNITSYPIVIDNISSKRKKKQSSIELQDLKQVVNTNPQDFQIVKLRLINTKRFLVTIKFTADKFIIIGDLKAEKQLKVIEISKEEAIKFIQEKCSGDIHKIFDFLRYDETQKSLYLLADVEQDDYLKNQEHEQRIKLRQKRQAKPIHQQIEENILQRQDLLF